MKGSKFRFNSKDFLKNGPRAIYVLDSNLRFLKTYVLFSFLYPFGIPCPANAEREKNSKALKGL